MFRLPHVRILGTNQCGNTFCEVFKRRKSFRYVFCRCDYSERSVASFSHQIQSGYYSGNQYVYIERISMDHLSAPTQIESVETPESRTHHIFFTRFFSNDRKLDSVTTTVHIKCIIELLKQCNILSDKLGKIW